MSTSVNHLKPLSSPDLAELLVVGIGVLRFLETLLPDAAADVESHSRALSAHFMTLSGLLNSAENLSPEIAPILSAVVTDLQFQDRNSQLINEATRIIAAYRAMLEEVDVNLTPSEDAVARISSHITLSDLRHRYLGIEQNHPAAQREGGQNHDGIEIF